MFYVAKGLQLAGITMLPIALVVGIEADDMWTELTMLLAGCALFGAGRMLERRR